MLQSLKPRRSPSLTSPPGSSVPKPDSSVPQHSAQEQPAAPIYAVSDLIRIEMSQHSHKDLLACNLRTGLERTKQKGDM